MSKESSYLECNVQLVLDDESRVDRHHVRAVKDAGERVERHAKDCTRGLDLTAGAQCVHIEALRPPTPLAVERGRRPKISTEEDDVICPRYLDVIP